MAGYITLAITVLMMFVEITPVKINPISWLVKFINKPVLEKVEENNKKLKELEETIDRNDIDTVRARILANDVLLTKGEIFTEDQWNCLYKDIKKWDFYHTKYEDLNGIIKLTIKHINECYEQQHYKK